MRLDDDQRDFIAQVATKAAAVAEISELAESRATNPGVRQLAEELRRESEKLQRDLSKVAQQISAASVATADRDELREITDDVREETGEDFNEAYVETVVNVFEDVIGRMNEAYEDMDQAELKSFASRHLATLRAQHRRAEELEKTL